MESDFVDLRTFHDVRELEEVLAFLHDEGIHAYAPGKEVAGMAPGVFDTFLNIPLRVPKAQADEARDLLEAFLSAEPEFVDFPEGDPLPLPSPRGEDGRTGPSFLQLWFFLGLPLVAWFMLGDGCGT